MSEDKTEGQQGEPAAEQQENSLASESLERLKKALESERVLRAKAEKRLKELERNEVSSLEEMKKLVDSVEASRRALERRLMIRDLVDAHCERVRDKAVVDRQKVIRFAEMLGEDADLDGEVKGLVADFSRPVAVKEPTVSSQRRADVVADKAPEDYTTRELAEIAKVDMARFNAIMDARDQKTPFLSGR